MLKRKKREDRNSNYELMRIVSMFMIVLWHFLIHSKITENTTGIIHIILNLVMVILVIHVNSFILVMGYHQCEKKIKVTKVISLIGEIWFYRVAIAVVLSLTGLISLGKLEIMNLMFPFGIDGDYWFLNTYIILYCFSPYINRLIRSMSQRQYKRLLCLLFLFYSIFSTITMQHVFFNNSGYSITNFIFLYLIGGYFKLYPIEKSHFFKQSSLKMRQLIFLSGFLGLGFVNFLCWNLANVLKLLGPIAEQFGVILEQAIFVYDNPLVMLQSVCYFLWFGTFAFHNKWVNRLAALTLGVYLIQENKYLSEILYGWVGHIMNPEVVFYRVIPEVLLISVIFFLGCLIIEWLRQIIFQFVANRKRITAFRQKIKNWVANLGIQVSW